MCTGVRDKFLYGDNKVSYRIDFCLSLSISFLFAVQLLLGQ